MFPHLASFSLFELPSGAQLNEEQCHTVGNAHMTNRVGAVTPLVLKIATHKRISESEAEVRELPLPR
jgi:hypothetical protein